MGLMGSLIAPASSSDAAFTYDSQKSFVNGNTGAELDMTAITLAWNRWKYYAVDEMLDWEFRVEFNKAMGAATAIALMKIPQIVNGVDTQIDISRIANGDAATNALCARLDIQMHLLTGGVFNTFDWMVIWPGSGLLPNQAMRRKYVKIFNRGGSNFFDNTAAANVHIYGRVLLPVG